MLRLRRSELILLTVLILLISSLIFSSLYKIILKVPNLDEPQFKNYYVDTSSFLKTFYLMKDGQDYYQAFKVAREQDGRGNLLSNDIFTWRTPIIFYFWAIFANSGDQIFILFLLGSFCLIFCAYLILLKVVKKEYIILGLLPLVLYLYQYMYASVRFLFIEWWGLFFFMVGLMGLFYKKNKIAFIFFVLAAITRELFILPIFCYFINSLVIKKERKLFLLVLCLSLAFFFVHGFIIRQITEQSKFDLVLFERLHQFSFANLRNMIIFSTDNFYFNGIFLVPILFWISIFSVIINFFIARTEQSQYLLIYCLSFVIFLPMISVFDNNYWGIFFMPIVIISFALIGNIIDKLRIRINK